MVTIKSKQEGDVAAEILECLNMRKNTTTIMGVKDGSNTKNILMNKILVMLLQKAALTEWKDL